MFDAEIAAMLLNRWSRHIAADEGDWHLELLREGNLAFTRECGFFGTSGLDDINTCVAESLYFVDGSRALRVTSPQCAGGWTEWAAFQPLERRSLQ